VNFARGVQIRRGMNLCFLSFYRFFIIERLAATVNINHCIRLGEALSVRTFCSVCSDCFIFTFWIISLNSFDSVFDLFCSVFVFVIILCYLQVLREITKIP
jgi:hypothetical protein